MNHNEYFKPTPLYKEFLILDLISKEPDITQRMMSNMLNVSLSMINMYLDTYESRGFIKREYVNPKDVYYHITKKGLDRMKVLNIGYLKASQSVHCSAKENIVAFLNQIIKKGFKKIILYGAGEVAEIMLQVIQGDSQIPIEVCAIIDDDPIKQGKTLINTPIISIQEITLFPYDGIFISSFAHQDEIFLKLLAHKNNVSKIIRFFEP